MDKNELKDLNYYQEYFKEDLTAIDEELKTSKDYSAIIDKEIKELSAPGLGVNKGAQHYLIEHLENAIALQTQREGLRKDRFAIKKAIMDYSNKNDTNNDSDINDLIKKLNETIAKDRAKDQIEAKEAQQVSPQDDAALDKEIDSKLK
jgi:hypothetical protein